MKALDTNVVIRFLVKDDITQAESVYRMFKQAEVDQTVFFIQSSVLLETIWVLQSVYEIPRQKILDAIDALLLLPILQFEHQSSIRWFVMTGKENAVDLSDILIACTARAAGCDQVLTFDRSASKLELFQLIQE